MNKCFISDQQLLAAKIKIRLFYISKNIYTANSMHFKAQNAKNKTQVKGYTTLFISAPHDICFIL
ncbi:MAG TPA: hypothetical protein DCE11_01490 [Ruminiclostridium sp.]|nr:hypothetical protein [Ruminiclostridium sp.]